VFQFSANRADIMTSDIICSFKHNTFSA